MIESYFGLTHRPFLAIPDVNAYYPSEGTELARQTVFRCLRRGEGISLILGPSGVGKTLLLRLLGQAFQLDFAVAAISNTRLKSPKSFLQQVLFELHQPFGGSDETELRLLLWDYLRNSSVPGVILLIDEAQSLSFPVFEEIRLLLNHDDGVVPRFRIALAGKPALEERLTHPKLTPFNQWVVSRSYLEPLNRRETSEYVLWQTKNAEIFGPSPLTETLSSRKRDEVSVVVTESLRTQGIRIDAAHHHGDHLPLFDDSARNAVFQLTEGVPRLINQLCDQALLLAYEKQVSKIDEPTLRSAWARLQQIPEPAVGGPEPAPTQQPSANIMPSVAPTGADLIEFGTLDEDESEPAETAAAIEIIADFKGDVPNAESRPAAVDFSFAVAPIDDSSESETGNLFAGGGSDEEWDLEDDEPEPIGEDEEESLFEVVDETDFANETLTGGILASVPRKKEDHSVLGLEKETSATGAEKEELAGKSNHVYQSRTFYEREYPEGWDETAMLNWIGPGHQVPYGFGIPYREVVSRNGENFEPAPHSVVMPLGMVCEQSRTNDPRCSLPGFLAENIPELAETPWGTTNASLATAIESPDRREPAAEENGTVREGKEVAGEAFREKTAEKKTFNVPDDLLVLRLRLKPNPVLIPRRKEKSILEESFEEEIPVTSGNRPFAGRKEKTTPPSRKTIDFRSTEDFNTASLFEPVTDTEPLCETVHRLPDAQERYILKEFSEPPVLEFEDKSFRLDEGAKNVVESAFSKHRLEAPHFLKPEPTLKLQKSFESECDASAGPLFESRTDRGESRPFQFSRLYPEER